MVKLILFDIDGLLIRPPHFYSTELEKQGYKNVEESLNSFYLGIENHNCLEGNSDIEKSIVPYLKKFGWRKSVVDYFDEAFQFEHKFLDLKFFDFIKQLREKGIKCCLCTDQEKYRAKFLLNDLDFQNKFDFHYISCNVGYRKCHEQFWDKILDDINKNLPDIKRNEIVFFDDLQSNIDVALNSGIQAFLFTDVSQFNKDLEELKVHV